MNRSDAHSSPLTKGMDRIVVKVGRVSRTLTVRVT